MRIGTHRLELLIEIVLIAFTLWQATIVVSGYAIPWASKIWKLRDDPALVRAGTLAVSMGPDVSKYVEFVRANTPENAKIYLPPSALTGSLSNPFLMQFYLFPRDIRQCSSPDSDNCLPGLVPTGTYVLYCGKTDPGGMLSERFIFLAFGPDCGIYSPPDRSSGESPGGAK